MDFSFWLGKICFLETWLELFLLFTYYFQGGMMFHSYLLPLIKPWPNFENSCRNTFTINLLPRAHGLDAWKSKLVHCEKSFSIVRTCKIKKRKVKTCWKYFWNVHVNLIQNENNAIRWHVRCVKWRCPNWI